MTLLITGDVSMQYDLGALATPGIPNTFKMIVLCNGGGGIFRFIDSTSRHPALDACFVADRPFPVKKLAEAYGFKSYEAHSLDELKEKFETFIAENESPAILAVYSDGALNAEILKRYLSPAK
jgi:2-succinyl-5-enolpyruvyl-6-hydroxy-3-cyclohexene-1-carboxylate synthase